MKKQKLLMLLAVTMAIIGAVGSAGAADLVLGEIYPMNEEVVPPGDVILQWVNLEPNSLSGAAETYVDVWFGTDPNKVTGPATGNYTKIANGESISTVTIPDPAFGAYYWQIDSYLHGKPTTADGTVDYSSGDPCMVEGSVHVFTNDAPVESVDVGPDMITWSGEAVQLTSDVVDNGGTPLTYSWTMDPLPVGVSVVIDPDLDVAAPSVTFTKSPYENASIINASFEDPDVADGTYTGATPTGWTKTGSAGVADAAPGAIIDTVSEGEQCLWANPNGTFSTVLSETVQAGATYTLSVDIGHGLWSNSNSKYLIQLIAVDGENELVLAEDDNSIVIASQAWVTSEVSYTDPVAGDPCSVAGMSLMIKLVNPEDGSSDVEFDNVVLTSDMLFPAAEGVSSIDLTLTVNDENNPAVSDSMTIDVYRNACEAAREGLGLDADADYDENCLVDVEDLATMAVEWLDDTSATEALVNPIQPGDELVVNGEFQLYKPGTNYTVTATIQGGYVIGVGDNIGHSGDGNFSYSDGTSGDFVDVPGWKPVDEAAAGQFLANGFEGTSGLNAFGSWAKTGNRIQSAKSLGKISGSTTYRISAIVNGGIINDINFVMRLELLADGVMVTPTSEVTPTSDTGSFQEISRTYDAGDLAGLIGQSMTILIGTGPSPDATQGGRVRFDNVMLDVIAVDESAPSVDAGLDMVTWLGEPVQLAPIIEPNELLEPQPVLVYNWTAETLLGYDVNISNSAIEAPIVTVTNVPVWREAPVVDPNFEERENFDAFPESTDKYIQWAREGWRYFEVDNNGGPVRIWNPGVKGVDETAQGSWDVGFDGNMPDGKYGIVVYTRYNDNEMEGIRPIRDFEAAVQIIDEAFNPNATYELTVKVGRLPEGPDEGGSINYNWDIGEDGVAGTADDAPRPGWNGYAVQLAVGGENVGGASYAGHVIGGTVVAEDYNNETVPVNGFATVTVTYTPGSASADLAGLPLQVRLCALENPEDHSTTSYAAFDDVTLMTDAPPALEPIELILSVNNEGSSTMVLDTMTIEVHENACEVIKAVDPSAIDDTDHNIDCTTNLVDFAVLAADWLDDYSLTTAVTKP